MYKLILYICGKTARSERAIRNLRNIVNNDLGEDYELNVIDVLEYPEKAEEEKILATPTLVKKLPPPIRRIIGDLSNKDKVFFGLNIEEKFESKKGENRE